MLFSGVPRVRLLEEPTPLHRLTRLGEAWGHPRLYIKRDDVMPQALAGNKVRSAEFWFGDALAKSADLILVAGRLPSNQCRVVAAISCILGLECHVIHNGEPSSEPKGNQLLHNLMGVKQIMLGPVSDEERGQHLEAYAAEMLASGRKPCIISDPVLAALGYVRAALELNEQAESKGYDIRHLVICGSAGPTEAGLLWGAALLGRSFTVHTPSVEYPADEIRETTLDICRSISTRLGFTPSVDPAEILVNSDDFLGEGYDIPTAESLQVVRELAALEGIFIESTYNAKVFASLKATLANGEIPKDEGICIFHTGGVPALFGQGERFVHTP